MALLDIIRISQWLLILIPRDVYSEGIVSIIHQLQQMTANHQFGDPDTISNPDYNRESQVFMRNQPTKEMICQTFRHHQRKLCHQHFRLMDSVVNGFLLGLNECQIQFKDHIWNCKGHNITVLPKKSKKSKPGKRKTYIDKLLSRSTPESAYVSSVISAGVAHQVTKACSKGVHDSCGCDRTIYDTPESANFKWSGCSHNIHFGAAFTRRFLDLPEKTRSTKRPEKTLTRLHNNHVGRQAVILKMGKKCKCHGVSGSCEMKTCIRALPDFRIVGDLLKTRFHSAMQVHFVNSKLIPRYPLTRMFTDNDLIYLSRSPDYCIHNPYIGSLGTRGRKCTDSSMLDKPSEEASGSCSELCCGRGNIKKSFSRMEQCRCKFQWCCDVKCDTCKKNIVEYICE